MPQIGSTFTIKKADNVTDIIWAALQGANGNDPLILRQDAGQPAGMPVGLRPVMRAWGKTLGDGTTRVLSVRTDWPYSVLNSTTSTYERRKAGNIQITVTEPGDIPPDVISEMVFQTINMLYQTATNGLNKVTLSSGYLPT